MQLKTFIVFIFSTILLSGCLKYEDVELKQVHDVDLKSIDENELKMEIELELYNPNNYKIKVTKADLDIKINQLFLGNSKLEEVIEIPPKASSRKIVKLNTQLDKAFTKELPGLLASAIFSGLKLDVAGKITGKAYWISHTFDIHHEEKINLNDLNLGG